MREPEKVILANMCMVYDDKGCVLAENRVDPAWPGIVFPGGHVEPGESCTDAVIREVWEETGLRISHPRLCDVKQWREGEIRQCGAAVQNRPL
jgi:8-oxo-dGTP diphosphatase